MRLNFSKENSLNQDEDEPQIAVSDQGNTGRATASGTPENEQGARSRKFTEQGKLYSEQQLSKCYNKLRKLSLKLRDMIESDETTKNVREMYKEWMIDYEHFLTSHNVHSKRLDNEDLSHYMVTHLDRESYLKDSKVIFENYLSQQDVERLERRSNRSSVKSLSSVISSKRLEEEERIAELEAKREVLKKRKDLELAKVALQMREEELHLELDLAVSEAKTKVFDKYEQSDYSTFPRDTKVKRDQSVHFDLLPQTRYGLQCKQSVHRDSSAQSKRRDILSQGDTNHSNFD